MQIDNMLNEICKASTMQAATALSKFLQVPIGLQIEPVESKQISEMSLLADDAEVNVSLYLPINGDLTGGSYFLYSQNAALSICDVLFHRLEGTTQSFSESEISALSEVANIVIGNFLTSFAHSLQLGTLLHQRATFSEGLVTNEILQFLNKLREKKLIVKISFGVRHVNNSGHVIILFEEDKIDLILKKFTAS